MLYFAKVLLLWYVVCSDASSLTDFLNHLRNHSRHVCPDVELTEREGVVFSPYYPNTYPRQLSCSWHIQGNIGDFISIMFDDIDIEESCCCESHPCCLYNWLKIGSLADASDRQFCGQGALYHQSLISSSHKLWIKFHISKFIRGGRGFRFHYKIIPRPSKDCSVDEFKCRSNQCISSNARCNGIPDCEDGSDEYHCSNRCASGRSCHSVFQCYDAQKHCDGIADCADVSDEMDCGFCGSNLTRCGANSTQCYNPLTQRCDRIFHCLNGEDERDCSGLCPGKLMCESRRGCFLMKDRCNGVAQCEDASDEKSCVPELCNYEHGGFLCDNGRCIQEVWTCDHSDDCGDGSDERSCLRNSVLTAAVMGSLICALLLVIAISCTCRLHALRMLENRLLSRETPLSRLSREFIFREPPPSYADAVEGQCQQSLCVENLHYTASVHRSRRRTRRSRRHRPTITAPPPPPPASRSCIYIDADGRPSIAEGGSPHESAITLPMPGSCSHSNIPPRPNFKNEDVLMNSVQRANDESKQVSDNKDSCDDDESVCPVISQNSDAVVRDPSVNTISESASSESNVDHYYCDSDSEPLVV